MILLHKTHLAHDYALQAQIGFTKETCSAVHSPPAEPQMLLTE